MNDFVRLLASGSSNRNRNSTISRNSPQGGYYGTSIVEESILANIKDKYSISIKATPSKDAITTRKLAIKSGHLLKRNEQGVWQKRFICTVPHTFLYYFESEVADSPRGIIDLDLMTNITREDNVLKISTAMEDRNRAFYFDCVDNNDNLNEWILSLIRDRYHVLYEERNAYQQMQSEISGVINDASMMTDEKTKEKELIEKQLYESNQTCDEAIKILKGILVNIGITEDEMSQLTDVFKIGKAIQSGMIKFKTQSESRYEEAMKIMESERFNRNEEIKNLEKKVDIEVQNKKLLESNILKDKKDHEQRAKELICQIDNTNLNIQMAISAKNIADNKISTLQEQKKVLIKEVKLLRKKLDESHLIINELKSLNDNLKQSSVNIELLSQINSLDNLPSSSSKASLSTESSLAEGSLINENNSNEVINKNKTTPEVLIPSIDDSSVPNNFDNDTTKSNLNFTSIFSTNRLMSFMGSSKVVTTVNVSEDIHDLNYDVAYKSNEIDGSNPGEIAWSLSPIKSDRSDMVWIDNGKVNCGNLETPNDSFSDLPPITEMDEEMDVIVPLESSTKTSFFSGAFSILGQSSFENKEKETNVPQILQTPSDDSSKISPLTRFSSMFSSSISQKNVVTPALLTEELLRDHESSGATYTPDFSEGGECTTGSGNKSIQGDIVKYICLKCSGTVEGPKLSTCKCSIPTLSSVVDNRKSSSGIVGILSKGTSVAGGFADGLMKVTSGLITSKKVVTNNLTPDSVNTESVENMNRTDIDMPKGKDSVVSDLTSEYNEMRFESVTNRDSFKSEGSLKDGAKDFPE